jgi:GT2 family glycosyltransferase
VVVDNAPENDASRQIVQSFAPRLRLKYVQEPTPGLSYARNKGTGSASHDIAVFIDDDERVQPDWLTALAKEFCKDESVGVVSGLILPAELRTGAQLQFEQNGGHSKGRGFRGCVFDERYLSEHQSALYPLPPFGAGGNMAFRVQVLKDIGGFDVALGSGTPAGAGEDTAAFAEALLAGWVMVYAPAAVVWHKHRVDDADLERQLVGYATGLGAFYAAMVIRDPTRLIQLAALARHAIQDLFAISKRARASALQVDSNEQAAHLFQSPFSKLKYALRGPVAYAAGRRSAQRRRRKRSL